MDTHTTNTFSSSKIHIYRTLWLEFFVYTDLSFLPGKPGVCPRWRFDFGHCAEFCSKDRDCPNNEKCCSNGCGHECMGPVIGEI
uniref:WAP domain-containing protein n=1 Tax=Oreochromis niloticus TaxID=8128 RepID=A0A669EUN7_ORENI